MSAILIISIFLLVAASLSIYRSKRSPSFGEAERLLPPEPHYKSLFAESEAEREAAEREAARERTEALRANLRERAAAGDLTTLAEAQTTGDAEFYKQILDSLFARAEVKDEDLRALSSFIARSDRLRSTPALAAKLTEVWAESPRASSAPELLRVAALSDDAATFQAAAETIFRVWAEGQLQDLKAAELDALFEAEYWLLSSDARRSGAGFVLKRALADLRRGLKGSVRREATPPSEEAGGETASH